MPGFVLPDLVASLPFGLAEAEAEALGLGAIDGAADGATTTSGEGVGSGCWVTLSLNQTRYVPNKIIIKIMTTMVILRLIGKIPSF
ncbi:MAG TPA: hypothetical protein VJG66_04850 [Patescibacteria group bacterium]|nr:hypothetical protein [Patescibacteria group bacterium]